MRITINIDEQNQNFDDIIDYVAENLKEGNLNGDASTNDTYYSWRTK